MIDVESALTYEHGQVVYLDKGTYHWVSLKRFHIDQDLTDGELLSALIAHWAYHDHYAGEDAIKQDHHSLHGPYRLECITAETFQPARPAVAHALLQAWAEEATAGSPSAPVQSELDAKVYPLLEAVALYQLPGLRPEAEHDWGWVVGKEAFLEYVSIARTGRVLTLIVAADD